MLLFNQWLGRFSSPSFGCFAGVFFSGWAGSAAAHDGLCRPGRILTPRFATVATHQACAPVPTPLMRVINDDRILLRWP